MFRKLLRTFCLRFGRRPRGSSVEDFVDEDLVGKPERMGACRWRLRSEEDELVLLAMLAEKTRPPPVAEDDYCMVIDKMNDGWLVFTTAEIHAPPATVEEEDIPPVPRRRRVCRRCCAERLGAKVVVHPHGGRVHRLTPRYSHS